jgi:SAM-dependent methyltransferase
MIDYHRHLLADEVRTSAYREAIRAVVKPGDVVVDLGCGTGILSFFACEAGASHVYAIDDGHAADAAALLARHLGFANRMTVFHDDSSRVELPERADVLLTETMGSLAFDEHILGSVLDARRRFLRDQGSIVPRRLELHAVPVAAPAWHDRHVSWWNEPRYGFDLSPLRLFASSSIHLVHLAESDAVADRAAVLAVDLSTYETTLTRGRVTFTATRDAVVDGFGVWFSAALTEDIVLDSRNDTHWRQALLPLETPLRVTSGAAIVLELETDDGKVWRWSGSAGGVAFDQMTWMAMPPCIRRDE